MKDLKRVVAFHISSDDNIDQVYGRIKASSGMVNCKTVVFCPSKAAVQSDIESIVFPDETNTLPQQKNFILKWFKDQHFSGFLHLVESNLVFNSKTQEYMDKLESTMAVLDYDIHLSTATDRCNYIFNKFCPRLSIEVDELQLKFQLGLPDKLHFTSHSNMSYMTFNFGALGDDVQMLDERFTIGMFFIIEFIARRKMMRKEGQLYYMNQYLSIGDEIGAYDIIDEGNEVKIEQDTMQKENDLFKSLNINYAPDNNIDVVLDALYSKIKAKNN